MLCDEIMKEFIFVNYGTYSADDLSTGASVTLILICPASTTTDHTKQISLHSDSLSTSNNHTQGTSSVASTAALSLEPIGCENTSSSLKEDSKNVMSRDDLFAGKELADVEALGSPFVAMVPGDPPLTRTQFISAATHWPTAFNEDKRYRGNCCI